MRVDAANTAPAPAADVDARTQLSRRLGAFRRRWYLLAVSVVVGAALGWVSAPSSMDSFAAPTPYYRASITLLTDQSDTSGNSNVSLSQAAYLVGSGEVPTAVAAELGVEVDEVQSSTMGLPHAEVYSVEISSIGTDRKLVTELADTSARKLLEHLEAEATSEYEQQRDEVIANLARLDAELDEINGLIAAGTGDADQLEARHRSVANQYSLAYEQFSAMANGTVTGPGLEAVGTARTDQITEAAYQRHRQEIRDGIPAVLRSGEVAETDTAGGGGGPSSVGPATRAAVGGMVGLALASGLVLVLDRLDNRLRTRDEVEAATDLAVVAEIPPLSRHQQHALEVVAKTQPRSRAAEAYRVVRGALLFQAGADEPAGRINGGEPSEAGRPLGPGCTVLVTSANPEEGKTTTVANLAAVLAEGGLSVLVINCDFRRPRVHKYLVPTDTTEPATVTQLGPVVLADTHIPGVRLVTGLGETDHDANPLEVVALQRRIIAMARPMFDVILLDTAPFLTTNDASELLPETDHVIVVVRAGKTRRLAAHRTAEVLERFDAPVLGIVLNDSQESTAAQYYYSYYLDGSGRKKRTDGYVSRSGAEDPTTSDASNGSNGAAPVPANAPPPASGAGRPTP